MADDLVQVDLVTPEKQFDSVEATLVEVPGTAGDFGVLPGHSPLISTIRPGMVTLHLSGGNVQRYLVLGGISEVTSERCTLLAEYLEDVTSVTREQAEKRLNTAKDKDAEAISDEDKRAADREMKIAQTLMEELAA